MSDNINDYRDKIQKNLTAEELNKNSQSVYLYDLIYIICKVFLFVILGLSYVLVFKNTENIKNILMDAKKNITDKLKPLAENLKPPEKVIPVENPEKVKNPDLSLNKSKPVNKL